MIQNDPFVGFASRISEQLALAPVTSTSPCKYRWSVIRCRPVSTTVAGPIVAAWSNAACTAVVSSVTPFPMAPNCAVVTRPSSSAIPVDGTGRAATFFHRLFVAADVRNPCDVFAARGSAPAGSTAFSMISTPSSQSRRRVPWATIRHRCVSPAVIVGIDTIGPTSTEPPPPTR